MIRAYIVGDDRVIAKLNRIYPAVQERLRTAIVRLAMQLVRHVVQDKLGGQVLGKYTHWRATNRLRNSINPGPLQDTGTGISQSVGTNVKYGRIHEYGFNASVQVKTHTRHITQAFGKLINPKDIVVFGYWRHMNLPERSFLRSALADMAEEIRAGINRAVAEGVKGA